VKHQVANFYILNLHKSTQAGHQVLFLKHKRAVLGKPTQKSMQAPCDRQPMYSHSCLAHCLCRCHGLVINSVHKTVHLLVYHE